MSLPARFVFALMSGIAAAAEALPGDSLDLPEQARPIARSAGQDLSVPYPNAAMYLERGIYASFAGGRHTADSASGGWQNPIFLWQGEVEYFYTEWFSGGFGFRITAGEPSGASQQVTNRYFLLGRFHRAWSTAAAHAGLSFGVNDITISLKPDSGDLRKPLAETNATIGLSVGGGWMFSRFVGATLGQNLDVSLVRQHPNSPHRAATYHAHPGLAVDLLRIQPEWARAVKALYLLSELQLGRRFFEKGGMGREFSWILGGSMAF